MKRNFFTLTELLTVIAIIGILAAIALPTFNNARQNGRKTQCLSNQKETFKVIQDAMNKSDGIFYSGDNFDAVNYGNDEPLKNKGWSRVLEAKNLIKNLEALRCPSLEYTTDSKTLSKDSLQEVYGVAYTTKNDGKLNFKGSQLDKNNGDNVAALMLGACTANSKKQAKALLVNESGSYENKFAAVHLGEVNAFFYDGSANTLSRQKLDTGVYYFPAQLKDDDEDDNGEAKKITVSNDNWLKK